MLELSLLGVTSDFYPGRELLWHSRQPHRHKEPFMCPRMFKPRSRHAARCPSGLDNKAPSICACMNVFMCVHMLHPFLHPRHLCSGVTPTTPSAPWWVQTACVGGRRISLWNVLNQQGAQRSTAVCACTLVCARVITSWTKLRFQGWWFS